MDEIPLGWSRSKPYRAGFRFLTGDNALASFGFRQTPPFSSIRVVEMVARNLIELREFDGRVRELQKQWCARGIRIFKPRI